MMNYEWRKAIDAMRRDGYAVTIFYPEEIQGTDPREVEEWMIDCVHTCLRVKEQDNDESSN